MPLSAQDLIAKARDQRRRERYAEAAVTARLATEQDPDNPSAWWELGLALSQGDDLPGAAEALEQLTQLAPEFSNGWEYFGMVLSDLDRDEEAIAALEKAFELGAKAKFTLKALRRYYEAKENKEGEYAVLKRMHGEGLIENNSDWNQLGNLHAQHQHFHEALFAYRKHARAKNDPASLFNMGLVYTNPQISQDADAIDVWRLALHRYPGEIGEAQTKIDALLPRLLELATRTKRFGATLLEADQWYVAYLNPFELLNVDATLSSDQLHTLDAKTLQRLKKQLLAEIDLEEGRVSWLDGQVVDRSRAIALCDELNDEQKKLMHWRVFQEPLLLNFLSRGEHVFFTTDKRRSPLELLELIEDPDEPFARWLSSIFARQYNLVLGKAIERHALPVIEVLFDGRRWVTNDDDDACFENARRQVEPLLQPLREAAKQAQSIKPTLAGVSALLSEELVGILNLLPIPFRSQQNDAVTLLREISLASHNVHDDTDLARQVLELTPRFQFKSAALNHQLQEDYEALQNILKRQRQHEVHLTRGQDEWKITKEFVQNGSDKVPVTAIQSFAWGATYDADGTDFLISFVDIKANNIEFRWRASSKEIDKHQAFFKNFIDATLSYVMPHVVNRVEETLKAGKSVYIGPVRVLKQGIVFERSGWFTNKRCEVPWPRLVTKIENGDLHLADRINPKDKLTLPLSQLQNAFVLHYLASRDAE